MNVSFEEINSTQKRIKIKIGAEMVETAFNKAFTDLKKKAKVQGFRPGKVPLTMIKKLYGASVASQVGEDLINSNLFEQISDQNLKIVSSPVIEATNLPKMGEEYEFAAILDIMPELEIRDYKGLHVRVTKQKVTPALVEAELARLAKQHAKSTPIEDDSAKAEEGQLATISHKVKLEGEPLPQMDVNQTPVALGKGELYPDLEKAIIGLQKGETKHVDITLPEDFQDKDLAGKTAQFEITLDGLANLDTPEINDEFAKDLNFDTKEKLEASIVASLEQQAEAGRKRQLEVELLSALLEKNQFDVPPAMVDEVIDSMIKEMYPGDNEPAKEAIKNQDMRASMKEEAKKRAKNTLLLWEIGKAEDIQVTDEDIASHIKKTIGKEEDSSPETEKQVKMFLKQVGTKIRENLLLEKSLDVLIENATIDEVDA